MSLFGPFLGVNNLSKSLMYSCALTSVSLVVVIFENAHRLRRRSSLFVFFRINEFDRISVLIVAFGAGYGVPLRTHMQRNSTYRHRTV